MGTRLAAATVVLRSVGVQLPGRSPAWHDVDLRGVTGRLWSPHRDRRVPPILLAAGVTPEGVDDPRVVRLAGAIAGTGRVVFVPEMALAGHRLEEGDVDRLVRAVEGLDDLGGGRGVAALGFSFGGSFCLVAAADERVAGRLRAVAAFGAYADLPRVLDDVLARGFDPETRDAVLAGLPLDEEGRRDVVRLLERGAPADEIVASLPAELRRVLERLSPVRVAGRVAPPVLLAHAVDDPTIPYAEFRRLGAAFPRARGYTVRLFTHVDFVPTRDLPLVLRDLWAVWDLARRLLGA